MMMMRHAVALEFLFLKIASVVIIPVVRFPLKKCVILGNPIRLIIILTSNNHI